MIVPLGINIYDQARLQGRLWTPHHESGKMLAWYDIGHEPSRTLSGSSLTIWKDRLRKAGDLGQATGTAQPTFNPQYTMGDVMNRPALLFDGGDWMDASLSFSGEPWMVIMVASFGDGTNLPVNPGRLGSIIRSGDYWDTGDQTCTTIAYRDGANVAVISNRGNVISASVPVVAHTPTIFGVYANTSVGSIGLNGAKITPGTGTFSLIVDTLVIGAGQYTGVRGMYPWKGPIWEVFITKTPNLYDKITGYVAHKLWPPGNNPLAAGHPFKNRPPLIGD